MALENSIQSSIINYINSLPEGIAENESGNAGQKGRADINACYKGRCYKIEVKSEETGYKPSKLQIVKLKKWARAGAVCLIVWSLDEVKTILDKEGVFSTSFKGWYITQKGEVLKGGHHEIKV